MDSGPAHPSRLLPTWTMILPNSGKPEFGGASRNDGVWFLQIEQQSGRNKMADAAEKIAIVTGAGTGVGRAASLALMKAGFTVVLAGRRLEMLEETKKLGDNVGNSLPVSADMTDPGSIAALFAKTMEVYGRLDLLFNNAGM